MDDPTLEQKFAIEQTTQAIFDARALYPDSPPADLYDETILRKAHENNDKAIMTDYGFPANMSVQEIVKKLIKMYQKLTNNGSANNSNEIHRKTKNRPQLHAGGDFLKVNH